MLFNVGGLEVLVIAVIALIAVGPEQLPVVIRKVGRVMGQVRTMAGSLRSEFMAGAGELEDLQRVADPKEWFGGSGSANDPIIRPGYADKAAARADDAAARAGDGADRAGGDAESGPIAADDLLAELDAVDEAGSGSDTDPPANPDGRGDQA
ncbi:MAG: Sec-independent protein translocase protein TatB [Acidimicrobiales bacterium]